MKLLAAILVVVFMFVYAILGAIVFHFIEIGNETNTINDVDHALVSYIASKSSVCNVTYSDIVTLNGILKQMDLGGIYMDADGKLVSSSFWDFRSSIYAAIDILNLVGTRDTMPHTIGGRSFVIVYTLIGIFLLFGSFILTGHLMMAGLDRFWWRVQPELCKRYAGLDLFCRQLVLAVIGTIFFILFPSIAFSKLEQWSYGRAVYYTVATVLLSIGFGDEPAHNHGVGLSDDFLQWYRLAAGIWEMLTVLWFGSILLSYDIAVADAIEDEAEKIVDVLDEEVQKVADAIEKKIENGRHNKPAKKKADSVEPKKEPKVSSSKKKDSKLPSTSDTHLKLTTGHHTVIQVP